MRFQAKWDEALFLVFASMVTDCLGGRPHDNWGLTKDQFSLVSPCALYRQAPRSERVDDSDRRALDACARRRLGEYGGNVLSRRGLGRAWLGENL